MIIIKSINIKIILLVVVLVLAIGVALSGKSDKPSGDTKNYETPISQETPTPTPKMVLGTDPLNTSYEIEGITITLTDGEHTEEILGSSTSIITKAFDIKEGSLRQEGGADTAVILTQESGGSGTFFYVAASLDEGDGYMGTNAIVLGDRIAMQTVEIENNQIIVNYADRTEDESMADEPSVGASRWFTVDEKTLVEIPSPNL
ncbi:hypothetical protein ACFL0F_01135 [Patescibacteria group bacterium]